MLLNLLNTQTISEDIRDHDRKSQPWRLKGDQNHSRYKAKQYADPIKHGYIRNSHLQEWFYLISR